MSETMQRVLIILNFGDKKLELHDIIHSKSQNQNIFLNTDFQVTP